MDFDNVNKLLTNDVLELKFVSYDKNAKNICYEKSLDYEKKYLKYKEKYLKIKSELEK